MKRRTVKRCFALLMLIVFMSLNLVPVLAESNLRVAKIAKLSGDVTVMKSGGEKSFPAFKNMGLLQGDKLITGINGSATLEMDEDKEIIISKSTQLVLSELVNALKGSSGSTSLNLLGGKVMVNIKKKLDGDSKFEIKTPTAVMGVRGTQFFVGQESGRTNVAVLSGTVVATMYTPTEGDGSGQDNGQPPIEVVLQQNQQVQLDQSMQQNGPPPAPEQVTQQNLDLFVLETIRDNPQGVDPGLLNNIDQVIQQRQLLQPPPPPPVLIPPPAIIWNNPLSLGPSLPLPPAPAPMPQQPTVPAPRPSGNGDDRGGNDNSTVIPPTVIPVSSITLNNEALTFTAIGTYAPIIASVYPSNATNKTVTWTSSNSNVATVDSTGKVTAAGWGNAVITASNGSVQATCNVIVAREVSITSATFYNIYGNPTIESLSAVLSSGTFAFPSISQGHVFEASGQLGSKLYIMLQTGMDLMDKNLTVEIEKSVNGSPYSVIGSRTLIMGSTGTLIDIPLESGSIGAAGTTVSYRLRNLYVDSKPATIANNKVSYTVGAVQNTKLSTPVVIGNIGDGDTQICGTGEPGAYVQVSRNGFVFGSAQVDPYTGYFNVKKKYYSSALSQGDVLRITAYKDGRTNSDVLEVTVQGALAVGLDSGTGMSMSGITLSPLTYTPPAKLYTAFVPNSVTSTNLMLSPYSGCTIVSVKKNGVDFPDYSSSFELPVGLTELRIEIAQSGRQNKTILVVISRSENADGAVPLVTSATTKCIPESNDTYLEIVFNQPVAAIGDRDAFLPKIRLSSITLDGNTGYMEVLDNIIKVYYTGYEGEINIPPDMSGPVLSINDGAVRSLDCNIPNNQLSEVHVTDGIAPSFKAAAFTQLGSMQLFFDESVNIIENDFISKVTSANLASRNIQITSAAADGNVIYVQLSNNIPNSEFTVNDLMISAGAVTDSAGNECIAYNNRYIGNYIPPQIVSFSSFVNLNASTVTLEVYFDKNMHLDTNCTPDIEIWENGIYPSPDSLVDSIGVWDSIGIDNMNLKYVTINLTANGTPLINSKEYYVLIPSEMFYSGFRHDIGEIYFPGISTEDVWRFQAITQ